MLTDSRPIIGQTIQSICKGAIFSFTDILSICCCISFLSSIPNPLKNLLQRESTGIFIAKGNISTFPKILNRRHQILVAKTIVLASKDWFIRELNHLLNNSRSSKTFIFSKKNDSHCKKRCNLLIFIFCKRLLYNEFFNIVFQPAKKQWLFIFSSSC